MGNKFLPIYQKRVFVPEVKEELANNSFCLWVISESRTEIKTEAIRKSITCLNIKSRVRDITKNRWAEDKIQHNAKELCETSYFPTASNPQGDDK